MTSTYTLTPRAARRSPEPDFTQALADRRRDLAVPVIRSHELPRNSGEGDAVNGPTPLAGGDDALEQT